MVYWNYLVNVVTWPVFTIVGAQTVLEAGQAQTSKNTEDQYFIRPVFIRRPEIQWFYVVIKWNIWFYIEIIWILDFKKHLGYRTHLANISLFSPLKRDFNSQLWVLRHWRVDEDSPAKKKRKTCSNIEKKLGRPESEMQWFYVVSKWNIWFYRPIERNMLSCNVNVNNVVTHIYQMLELKQWNVRVMHRNNKSSIIWT